MQAEKKRDQHPLVKKALRRYTISKLARKIPVDYLRVYQWSKGVQPQPYYLDQITRVLAEKKC